MSTEGRPLSPHLTIYRWPVTMILSILHRLTGIALSVGLIGFVVWLEAIAFESVPYDALMRFLEGAVGRVLLLGWTLAFFFHLANGVRHLIWDSGSLFEKHQAEASSWFVLGATVVLTAGYWILV